MGSLATFRAACERWPATPITLRLDEARSRQFRPIRVRLLDPTVLAEANSGQWNRSLLSRQILELSLRHPSRLIFGHPTLCVDA